MNTVMKIVLLAIVALLAILFRNSIKRIFQSIVRFVVMKGVPAFREGR